MTACTNHGGKARRVVTAALVGVLSVGTVPMVALAEGVNDGIQTLAADWTTDAKVTSATDGQGNQLTGDLTNVTFPVNSKKYLVPTIIEGRYETITVDPNNVSYEWGANSYGYTGVANPEEMSQFANQVFYAIVNQDGATTKFAFKYVDEGKLENVHVDGNVVFNAESRNNDFLTGDIALVDADGKKLDGAKIQGLNFTTGAGDVVSSVVDPGDYVANFQYGDYTYAVPFTVAPLDLSEASIVLKDKVAPFGSDVDVLKAMIVNGDEYADITALVNNYLDVVKVSGPNGYADINGGYGEYTFTIGESSAAPHKGYVTGSATVTFNALNVDLIADGAIVKYGRQNITASGLDIYLEDGDAFDASKVSVVLGDDTYTGEQLELTFFDTKENKVVDASALTKAGAYEMSVRIKPFQDFATNYWVGGMKEGITVDIIPTTLNENEDVAFFFDGEISGDKKTVTYDGTDHLDDLTVAVNDGSKEYVEGTDYTLEVTNKAGDKVEEAVNADVYTVTVKPITFAFKSGTEETFELTVEPVKLTYLCADADGIVYNANGSLNTSKSVFEVPYTGSAVEVPGALYEVDYKNGKYGYAELPADVYNVVTIKSEDAGKLVNEAIETGDYTVTVALTDSAKGNYQLLDNTFTFTVREFGHFTDVNSAAWYAVPVEQAYKNAYVNGIANTNLFAPEAEITRADVACILYNMAGTTNAQIGNDEFGFSEIDGYITGFDDVDGHAYYAQAIAWAHASGVVNGHEGSFRPMDKITREEFASMLANFAQVKGDFVAADGSALAALPDASTVSGWAEANVAWAVEQGIMGNGGYVAGQSNITRAEVAAMAVNYQPTPLVEVTGR